MIRSVIMIASAIIISQNAFGQVSSLLDSVIGKAELKKEVVSTKESEKFWEHGSIMYSKKSIDWVNQAIKSFDEGIPLEILLPDIFPPEAGNEVSLEEMEVIEEKSGEAPSDIIQGIVEMDRPSSAPVFYLNSILYFSPDNWAVWINDEKVSVGEKHSEVDIVKVMEKEVALVWRDTQIDLIYPDWKESLSSLNDGRFVSNKKNIVVDRETGDVSFIIGINQTFNSANLEIVEGKREPGGLTASEGVDANEPPPPPPDFETGGFEEEEQIIKPNEVKKGRLGESIDFGDAGGENMDNYMQQLDMLKSILGK